MYPCYNKQIFLSSPYHELNFTCLAPKSVKSLSLDKNLRAKKGGKENTGDTALRLPYFSFPWSIAFRHQSLAFRARPQENPCHVEYIR